MMLFLELSIRACTTVPTSIPILTYIFIILMHSFGYQPIGPLYSAHYPLSNIYYVKLATQTKISILLHIIRRSAVYLICLTSDETISYE